LPRERRVLRPKSHRRCADACSRTVLLSHCGFGKLQSKAAPSAQSNLGILYLDGRGVARDDTEAAMWFRKAADQGDAVAEFLLGNQYANAKGVLQDHSEAMFWFHRAAEQGHPVAKLYLGVMYTEGRGVPQDYVRAHMWISLSAAQGEKSCQDSRNDRTADDPSSGKRSAAALTRLEPATQPTPH
jgi:TPR repeat protein